MNEQLVIIGAKGHGKVVADIARDIGRYKTIVFLDDDTAIKESMGIPVAGKSEEVYSYLSSSDVFVAIGNKDIRQKWLEQLRDKHAELPVLVHSKAVIGTNVSIGCGTAVMAGAVVSPEAVLGSGCIINTCASVDHDCILENYVHVAVGAHLAGNVKVGHGTWIGAGAVVRNNIEICGDCIIGAGAAVVKNIRKAGTYIGVPAAQWPGI